MITSQKNSSHLHLVQNRLLLCLGLVSPLSKTLSFTRTSPLSTSSECDDCSSSSTWATLAWPSTHLSVLPCHWGHSKARWPSSLQWKQVPKNPPLPNPCPHPLSRPIWSPKFWSWEWLKPPFLWFLLVPTSSFFLWVSFQPPNDLPLPLPPWPCPLCLPSNLLFIFSSTHRES